MFANPGAQVSNQLSVIFLASEARLDDHKRDYRLTGGVIVRPHDRCFGDRFVGDQGGFDFHCGEAMTRHIHHIVHSTQDPDVTVGVQASPITGEILVAEASPVSIDVSLGVTPDATKHRRPRLGHNEQSACSITDGDTVFA